MLNRVAHIKSHLTSLRARYRRRITHGHTYGIYGNACLSRVSFTPTVINIRLADTVVASRKKKKTRSRMVSALISLILSLVVYRKRIVASFHRPRESQSATSKITISIITRRYPRRVICFYRSVFLLVLLRHRIAIVRLHPTTTELNLSHCGRKQRY